MNTVASLSFTLTVLFCMVKGDPCEPGWKNFKDYCYKINIWKEMQSVAELGCFIQRGELASVSSVEVLEYLTSQVIRTHVDTFWVGLQILRGKPVWSNNITAENQPWVDLSGRSQFGRTCFIFNGAKIVSHNCSKEEGFICERRIIPSPLATTLDCPSGTFSSKYVNKCLWTSQRLLPKNQAVEECTKAGGTNMNLLDIHREGINNIIHKDILKNSTDKYWLNLTWHDDYKSDDNGSVVAVPVGESGKIVSTLYVEGLGECAAIAINSISERFTVHDIHQMECDDKAYIICQGDPILLSSFTESGLPSSTTHIILKLGCPHGYNWKEDKVTGFCYWETSYETERLTWDAARKYCQSYGGDLASFHSIEEERIGLSFQYGALAHSYWIGLKYDLNSNNYVWNDGSLLDYENWSPGQPNTQDLRMRCVQMDASLKKWTLSYCGVLSWFICKARKQLHPKPPVLPTPEPLEECSDKPQSGYYLDGYCYQSIPLHYSWHRAQTYCENKAANLVSVHSEKEVNFLLRLLYADKALSGNRVWIGLNSLGLDGSFKWSDGTVIDFVNWNEKEPNNFQNQEKCCNMYIGNALWNDENCNAVMGFVCKWKKNANTGTNVQTTVPPVIGNCEPGWYGFQGRCYLPMGTKKSEWTNWIDASVQCHSLGGYLASVRNAKDQAFLSYLMQNLKSNTWIGLHDTIHSGVYYWMDNSPMFYANWAPGEPSLFGMKEDCVMMVYDNPESGIWKDEVCSTKLPFICQKEKDPSVLTPWIPRHLRCLHLPGWLKHNYSCYKLFNDVSLTAEEAENACTQHGGHLVSISDFTAQTVVKYLATNVSEPFWIGLRLVNDSKFYWIHGLPMTFSKWEKNEPSINKSRSCVISSPSGYWQLSNCFVKRPFICQAYAGKVPSADKVIGTCPKTSSLWVDIGTKVCYMFEKKWSVEWYTANFRCFIQGGFLTSIHSLEEMLNMKKYIEETTSVYIGLTTNQKGGFAWSDGTPVDFINWDKDEPNDKEIEDQCVEMRTDTLKWRVIPCSSRRNSICSIRKELAESELDTQNLPLGNESSSQPDHLKKDQRSGLSSGVLAVIIIIILVALMGIVAAFHYFYQPLGKSRFQLRPLKHSVSFENALFNEDSTMEFHNEKNTVSIHS